MMSNPEEQLRNCKEVFEFRRTLTNETDRGCALMAAAFLDIELAKLLAAFFVQAPAITESLLGQGGPLAAFSSRIDLCYALGLIGQKTHHDLHLILRIRNDFAQTGKLLKFEEPSIAARCHEFYYDTLVPGITPRGKFARTVVAILAIIQAEISQFKERAPKKDVVIDDTMRRKVSEIAQVRARFRPDDSKA
jgi:DNA-binding MltR family transcriptional regulator